MYILSNTPTHSNIISSYILDYCICFKTFYKSLSMHANFEFYPSKISIWTGQKPFDESSIPKICIFLMQNCENKFCKITVGQKI